MRNSNKNQLSLDAELSPAEWMTIIKRNINKGKKSGADVSLLERKQQAAFQSLQHKFTSSSRV